MERRPTQLKRVFYTSEIVADPNKDQLSDILSESRRNNAARGITGVLLEHAGQYHQILEGEEQAVDLLLERLRSDPRHRRLKVRFSEPANARMFDAWSMAHLKVTGKQLRLILHLLTSGLPASAEIGLTFLKYWLTTQEIEPNSDVDQSTLRVWEVEKALEQEHKSRRLAVLRLCSITLIAALIDSGFFLFQFLAGNTESLPMLQSYAVGGGTLLVALWFAYRGSLSTGIRLFQIAAFTTSSLHALWAGYGIFAPTLPYVGAAIAAGTLSNKRESTKLTALVAFALIGLTGWLSVFSEHAAAFSKPIDPRHAVLAGLFFPVGCLMLMEASSRNTATFARFTAGILANLTDTIASLKKSMAARNHFFSAISHEIRTPMNGVMSALALIEHPKASHDVKTRSAEALRLSFTKLSSLLDDMQDISRLESGHFDLTIAAFDIHATTRTVVESTRNAGASRGNTLTLNLPETPLMVMGDRQRYEQMLSHLLSNAMKFTENGHITINFGEVADGTGPHEHPMWRCEVTDTGVGIAENDIEKLFTPLSHASGNGFSHTAGCGLGLALVAALARQMKGDVGVRSTEGQGSTFWFTFRMPTTELRQVEAKQA